MHTILKSITRELSRVSSKGMGTTNHKTLLDVPHYKEFNHLLDRLSNYAIRGGIAMTKKRGGFRDMKFVNAKFTTKHKKDFESWLNDDATDVLEHIEQASYDGIKLSHRWDGENDCAIVSGTMQDDSSPNYNHCLVVRGSTPVRALYAFYWIYTTIYQNSEWAVEVEADVI